MSVGNRQYIFGLANVCIQRARTYDDALSHQPQAYGCPSFLTLFYEDVNRVRGRIAVA